MLSYPYLLACARAVLLQSAAIQGRVYLAPFQGGELNSDNLEQIIADTLSGEIPKAYPLSLILPPVSEGDIPTPGAGTWEDFAVYQLFLKQEGRTSGGDIQDADIYTNQSQHTIAQDWHDMRRVGINYLGALKEAIMNDIGGAGRKIQLSQKAPLRVIPVTRIGTDRLNGVLMTYRVRLFDHCAPADYPNGTSGIVLPNADQHPEHAL